MSFDSGLDLLITILSISLVFSFIRLYRGPNVPNRTMAFDVIAVHAVGMLVLYGMRSGSQALTDVAMVTAVLGFMGTTMLARYLERAHARQQPNETPTSDGDPSADWADLD
jgi:multisubunit Na+/H+ antiporter MnhF subunit